MLERLTDAAINSITFAEERAKRTGFSVVESGHLLLGILSTECDAVWILEEFGVDLSDAVEKLSAKLGNGLVTVAKASYSSDTREILRLACAQADIRSSREVGTVDLLAGLLKFGQGLGFELLEEIEVNYNDIVQSLQNRICSEKQSEFLSPNRGRNPARAVLMNMIADAEKELTRHEAAAQEARIMLTTLRRHLAYFDRFDK
ncbi:MAG: Clp protease N-terminal domain-containing protein [Candidatus Obscuribacterales bacterium]